MNSKAAFVACTFLALVAPLATAQAATDGAPPASDGQSPIATSGAKATDDNIARFLDDQGRTAPDAEGGPGPGDVVRDKAPHGEVGFSVGNHGYREAYGVVTVPLGEHGSATLAASQGQMNFRGRDLSRRSLALRVALGDAAGPGLLAPDDVCDIHRSGARAFEPYWLTRLRQDQLAQQGRPCPD